MGMLSEIALDVFFATSLVGTWKIPLRVVGQTKQWAIQAFCEIELRVY